MVDVLLSIDLVQLSTKGKITDIAVVAGDSDFVPALKIARSESILVWLYHGSRLHAELRAVADERVEIDGNFISEVLQNTSSRQLSQARGLSPGASAQAQRDTGRCSETPRPVAGAILYFFVNTT